MDKNYVYSIVIPVLNEEKVLNELYQRLTKVMTDIGESYEIIFINDGSTDNSLKIMKQLQTHDKRIKIIDFSRNFGHQIAITAGIDFTSGDAVITIDADLQDPPEVIPDLIKKWKEGYEVIYGIREKRKGENFFKKISTLIFYRLINKMTMINMPPDSGDFRLIDKKVVNNLKNIRENNRYVRGLTYWIGFKQIGVPYERDKRFAGKSKYPIKKLFKLAYDAIFSFSNFPLKIATYFGFIVSFLSFLYLIYALIIKLFTNSVIHGWTSLMISILFLGGVQLICLGIIGEYIARINDEVKKRPLYIIKEIIDEDK
jgi:dolichol-phosphate mannosyltransferase